MLYNKYDKFSISAENAVLQHCKIAASSSV